AGLLQQGEMVAGTSAQDDSTPPAERFGADHRPTHLNGQAEAKRLLKRNRRLIDPANPRKMIRTYRTLGTLALGLKEPFMDLVVSKRSGRHSILAVALTALVMLHTAPASWAWGPLGHRVIARLAERKLNPKAKAAVASLLEEAETMADAAN